MSKPKAFSYIRVSHYNSKVSGLSPESQIRSAIEYRRNVLPGVEPSEHSHCGPKGFFQDLAVSAWKGEEGRIHNRPGGAEMLRHVKRGDHIIFYSVDRGFRRVSDFGQFLDRAEKEGWIVHFIKEGLDMSTPSGKMRAHIYASIAEYYSSLLSMRIKEALAVKGMRRKNLKVKSRPVIDCSDMIQAARKPPKDKKKVPGRIWTYRRVSDDKQVDSGLGLKGQENGVSAYAKKLQEENELLTETIEVEDKGVSAFKTFFRRREGGKTIMQGVKRGDHIVAWRFDRIFRSVKDLDRTVEELDRIGVTLHIVNDAIRTDDRQSRVHMNLLVSLAQMESEMKSIRQLEAIEVMRSNSRLIGTVPRGNKVTIEKGRKKVHYDWQDLVDYYAIMVLTEEKRWSYTSAQTWVRMVRALRDGAPSPYMKYAITMTDHIRREIAPLMVEIKNKFGEDAIRKIREEGRKVANAEISEEWKKKASFQVRIQRKVGNPLPF